MQLVVQHFDTQEVTKKGGNPHVYVRRNRDQLRQVWRILQEPVSDNNGQPRWGTDAGRGNAPAVHVPLVAYDLPELSPENLTRFGLQMGFLIRNVLPEDGRNPRKILLALGTVTQNDMQPQGCRIWLGAAAQY